MKKSIFLTSVLLIFIGLSVSANPYAIEYKGTLPSEQAVIDAGIFGSTTQNNEMFGSGPQRTFGDLGDGGGFDDGGIEDCVDCYNDASIGGGISILALLAGAYGFFLTRRRKEQV